jgi:hypothetical protein
MMRQGQGSQGGETTIYCVAPTAAVTIVRADIQNDHFWGSL